MIARPDKDRTKLTLGIDKQVIDKAKAAGINISSVTELLLKAMTFEPKRESYNDVLRSYENFLDAIKQILSKYKTGLTIGKISRFSEINENEIVDDTINLDRFGVLYLWNDELEVASKVSVDQIINDLYPVNQILQDLLQELIKVSESSKDKLRELTFALKFLKTLSEDEKELKS